MPEIPELWQNQLQDVQYGIFACVHPEYGFHMTPMNVSYDGEYVLVNTVENTAKYHYVKEDPRVGILVFHPSTKLTYISIAGTVTEMTTEGAIELFNRHVLKSLGIEDYYSKYDDHRAEGDEDVTRVTLKIQPEWVHSTRHPYET
jgi:general stress protein 26